MPAGDCFLLFVLQSGAALLARSDADDVFNFVEEDFAVADVAGIQCVTRCFDHLQTVTVSTMAKPTCMKKTSAADTSTHMVLTLDMDKDPFL